MIATLRSWNHEQQRVYRGTITKAQAAALIDGKKYFVAMTSVVSGFEVGWTCDTDPDIGVLRERLTISKPVPAIEATTRV